MFHLFVVFHKYIFDECYEGISSELLNKYVTFVAVNKSIPKIYTPGRYNVINEWDLPAYDATLQERGFKENSVIYHIHANNMHKPYKFIGFLQYDMILNSEIFADIESKLNDTSYLALAPASFEFCAFKSLYDPFTLAIIMHEYTQYFKKEYDRTQLCPLLNTYIIGSTVFDHIMPWVIPLYNKIYDACVATNSQHSLHWIASIFERVMAYVISQQGLTPISISINHDHRFKSMSY